MFRFLFVLLLLVAGAVLPTFAAKATRRAPEGAAQAAYAADADAASDRWRPRAIPLPRTSPGGGIDVDEPEEAEAEAQEKEWGMDADARAAGSWADRFKDHALTVAAITGGAAVVLPTEWVASATDVVAEWVDGESILWEQCTHRRVTL